MMPSHNDDAPLLLSCMRWSRADCTSESRLQGLNVCQVSVSGIGVRLLVGMLSSCSCSAELTPQLPRQHSTQQHSDHRQIRLRVPRCRSPSNICKSDAGSQSQRAARDRRLSVISAVATTTGGGGDGGSIPTNPKSTADEEREPEGSSLADADALLAKARTNLLFANFCSAASTLHPGCSILGLPCCHSRAHVAPAVRSCARYMEPTHPRWLVGVWQPHIEQVHFAVRIGN